MNWANLIPYPDPIPASWGILEFLNVFTFTIHILLMNVILGGSLLLIFTRIKHERESFDQTAPSALASKIPTMFALTVTFGVAPLLFLQVLYGHLFYSSSILMAVFWILIIPGLILAYYGAYIHALKLYDSKTLSMTALIISSIIMLYIAFMFVNNITLMYSPQNWSMYFENRGGVHLNLGDPTIIPRFLHFVVASIAVAGLFSAIVWHMRERKGLVGADVKVQSGLRVFGFATALQALVGIWFLLVLPRPVMMIFMGHDMVTTISLTLGILLTIGVIVTAFKGSLRPTLVQLLLLIVTMMINRAYVRSAYLRDFFDVAESKMAPQYGVMILFFVIFILGLISVGYMIKLSVNAGGNEVKA